MTGPAQIIVDEIKRHGALILQLQGATAGLRGIHGPFDTGVTSGITANSDVLAHTFTHNLRITGSQIAAGFLYDGNYASLCSWRASIDSADQFKVYIGNPTATNGRQAGWLGVIIELG